MNSFSTYIRKRPITRTAAGRFVAKAKLDEKLLAATTWEDVRNYLALHKAGRQTISAARDVWLAYKAIQSRRN